LHVLFRLLPLPVCSAQPSAPPGRSFDGAQEFDDLGRGDVLVVGGQQTIGFDRVILATLTTGLRAIERPIAPAQIVFPEILNEPAEPLAVPPTVKGLARAKFTDPQRDRRSGVEQVSGARVVGLPQSVVVLELLLGGGVGVRRVDQAMGDLEHNRQLGEPGEVGRVLRPLHHNEKIGIGAENDVTASFSGGMPVESWIGAAPLRPVP